MALLWRLKVWTPVGVGPRTIERDDSFIRGAGLRMQVTPNGDCKEATFTAKGSGILIPPLSAVQFEYHDGTAYTPLFYGQVRVGGNSRDVLGETYTLRSLALRLKSVTLPEGFTTPKQAAHLTIRAMIQAVVASGQLDGLILYDSALIPDLGFDCREIKNGNQQNPWALLEQLQQDGAAGNVALSFGVRPDRKFFCQLTRTDNLTLSETEIIGKTWKSPVAEAPCTAVMWFVGKKMDGTPLTYESVSPDAATYGKWSIPQAVPSGVEIWETASGVYEWWAGGTGPTDVPVKVNPQPSFNPALLTDKVNAPDAPEINVVVPGKFVELRFYPASPVQRINVGGRPAKSVDAAGVDTNTSSSLQVASRQGNAVSRLTYVEFATWAGVSETFSPPANTDSYVIRNVAVDDQSAGQRFRISEFRLERINTALLDGLAKFFYVTPAQEPADLESNIYRPPADLAGRVTLGNYARAVEAWEYRVSAKRGLTLATLTGQADDPMKLATAALIKARDNQSVITAVTAQT